jgi:hypothetical protein
MAQIDVQSIENSGEGDKLTSRRGLLLGSGSLLVGGIAGRSTVVEAAPQAPSAAAPPLPWQWTRIDPMEAGTRAYQTYLKSKG